MSEFLSYGMVGGGMDSLIGDIHRKGAAFDGKAEIAAGCFSRNYANTLSLGKKLGLDQGRLYKDYREMAAKEAKREDKIDFVIIVTPNSTHYEITKAFLEEGIHVVCDKPFTLKVEEAKELINLAEKKNLLNCITYTYSGYPMVKQAREIVKSGELGKIRMVMGEYLQEWLAMPVEKNGNKQAGWRLDPAYSGAANCLADIGSHIENTVSYMTGLEIESLCANLDRFVEGRVLDDNAEVLLKYAGGARGIYWCTQVAIGYNNQLKIRILGDQGSLEWQQESPNDLRIGIYGKPVQILSRGRDPMCHAALKVSHLPGGHPEGYIEAFAGIYNNFADALLASKNGKAQHNRNVGDFPTFKEGLKGVEFIQHCVSSSQKGAVWIPV